MIGHGRRKIIHFGVTAHPTSPWVVQQLRDAFPEEPAPRFLIYDNDSIFSERVTESIKKLGIEPQRTALSESEPPNLSIEKNAGSVVFDFRNPQSPVRIREGLTAKTPRNRGVFSDCSRLRARSLCDGRLSGGASDIRTLSILWRFGESIANPNRVTWRPRNSNSPYGSRNFCR